MRNFSAFVCHNSNHWIALRKVHGEWYNLNSTNTRAPQLISDFLLTLFLESAQEGGYLIFGIAGEFPVYTPEQFGDNLRAHQCYLTADFIRENCENDKKRGKFKLNIGSGEQEAIDKACEESLRIWQENEAKKAATDQQQKGDKNAVMRTELEKQFKMFQGQGVQVAPPKQNFAKCEFRRLGRRR